MRNLIVLLTLIPIGMLPASAQTSKATQQYVKSVEKLQYSALIQQMRANRLRYGIAGQALMVMHNGRVLFRDADGEADIESHEPMTPDHVFPMHSVSKLFASTLIMQLSEQGMIVLDAPACHYVSGVPAAWDNITMRQLLNLIG